MRILALDSSGLVASVALVEEKEGRTEVIASYSTNYKKTHSQTLLPMIDEMMRRVETEIESVDAIGVSNGPGSFTGLRIGVATAKGLAFALGKPIIEVPTLEALAFQLPLQDKLVCPIMDARRNQVYTGIYRTNGDKVEVVLPQTALKMDVLKEKLKKYKEEVLFLGDGVPVYFQQLMQWKKEGYALDVVPAHLSRQNASSVGVLALAYWKQGRVVSGEACRPEYLRVSQAERERMEKEWVVEKWKASDIEQIAELEASLFLDGWSLSSFRESFAQENVLGIIGRNQEKVIGYLLCYLSKEEGNLVKIGVDAKFQRRGVGNRLLKEMEREVETGGIKEIFLEVRKSNHTAISFYEKEGFLEVGFRKDFYENPKEDGVCMKKVLGGDRC